VAKFFPTIDHSILLAMLGRTIADPQVLRLCERIVRSGEGVLDSERELYWFPGDDLFAVLRPQGLPIGNLTSQFWANVYLNELDQFVKRELKCRAYLRYADDFLLFHDDKAMLHAWMRELRVHSPAYLLLHLYAIVASLPAGITSAQVAFAGGLPVEDDTNPQVRETLRRRPDLLHVCGVDAMTPTRRSARRCGSG
jgi:hypothetical protein